MRKTYLPYQYDLHVRFPNLQRLGDAELAVLHSLYFLLKAEDAGRFYLIFDYHPTLPTSATELAALPQGVLETTYAVLDFDTAEERDREVEAIRLSLRGDDDNPGVGARLEPVPPSLSGKESKKLLER